jgi:hypothetical protein
MATILELAKPPYERLIKLDAALKPREQEFRRIYLFPRARDKLANEASLWDSQHNLSQRPIDQLSALISRFASGDFLIFDHDFRGLRKIVDGVPSYEDEVWELKTADVRVFGWFYERDCFIAVSLDEVWRVKAIPLYAGYRSEVIRYREGLELDEPKFISGGEPVDVVSNFYPA